MTGDLPDDFIPDGRTVIDFYCVKCGEYTEYGMASGSKWICPACGGYV